MIYLDNAASAPLHPEVREAMEPWLVGGYGNPSSLHSAGREAREAIEDARGKIADIMGVPSEDIIFTSGGSEANTLAINTTDPVFCSKIEHASIISNPRAQAVIDVDSAGKVHLDAELLSSQTSDYIVSVMAANNEIGTVQDVDTIADTVHIYGGLLHMDAVQAFGKTPIDVNSIDAMTISGHKIGGPRGIGVLYANTEYREHISPIIYGGAQERGWRPGTECTAGIVGLAKAVEVAYRDMAENQRNIADLRKVLLAGLAGIQGTHINGDPLSGTGIISVTIDGVPAEQLLAMMDMEGICASAGSACHAGSRIPSHVLKAIGLANKQCAETIRLSIGAHTTIHDIDVAVDVISKCSATLRGMGGKL